MAYRYELSQRQTVESNNPPEFSPDSLLNDLPPTIDTLSTLETLKQHVDTLGGILAAGGAWSMFFKHTVADIQPRSLEWALDELVRGQELSEWSQTELTLIREANQLARTREVVVDLVKWRAASLQGPQEDIQKFAIAEHICGYFGSWDPSVASFVSRLAHEPTIRSKKRSKREKDSPDYVPINLSRIIFKGVFSGDETMRQLVSDIITDGPDSMRQALLRYAFDPEHARLDISSQVHKDLQIDPQQALQNREGNLQLLATLASRVLTQSDMQTMHHVSDSILSGAAHIFLDSHWSWKITSEQINPSSLVATFGHRGLLGIAKALGDTDLQGNDIENFGLRAALLSRLIDSDDAKIVRACIDASDQLLGVSNRSTRPPYIDMLVRTLRKNKSSPITPEDKRIINILMKHPSRFGLNSLMGIVQDKSTHESIRWRVLTSLTSSDSIDPDISKLAGTIHDHVPIVHNQRRKRIISAVSDILHASMQPMRTNVMQVMAGVKPDQLLAAYDQLLTRLGKTQETLSVTDVAQNPVIADNVWMFNQPQDVHYSNTLSLKRYHEILRAAHTLLPRHQEYQVVARLRDTPRWQQDYQHVYEQRFLQGIDPIQIIIKRDEESMRSAIDHAYTQIAQYSPTVIKFMVLQQIIGQIDAAKIQQELPPGESQLTGVNAVLEQHKARIVKNAHEEINTILEQTLPILGDADVGDLFPAYVRLSQLIQPITDAEAYAQYTQLLQKSIQKLTGTQNDGLFSDIPIRDGQPMVGIIRETILPMHRAKLINPMIKNLELMQRNGLPHIAPVIKDILIDIRTRKAQVEEAGVSDSQTYYLHYLPPKTDPIKRIRAGDARESCLNTTSGNADRIAGLSLDEGSMEFIITTPDGLGCGHIHTKVGITDTGESACIDEGLYFIKGSAGITGTRAIIEAIQHALGELGFSFHIVSKDVDYNRNGFDGYDESELTITRLTSLQNYDSYSESGIKPNQPTHTTKMHIRIQ